MPNRIMKVILSKSSADGGIMTGRDKKAYYKFCIMCCRFSENATNNSYLDINFKQFVIIINNVFGAFG